ncbi:DUF397 domain-containing protein [Streptomyces echinoruber]|uniref:DUF397 domain-containing protein n=1 Tax=Streptomyces echinoruber TaxID=68898 RepID=A0A918VAA7_9ACTN|nr:DUF397 domain-containing protein [Streptomyces echinoruber]GGZ80708.1 hypothetical protein GCM10010389_18220 [Streptomyces echinoruber]
MPELAWKKSSYSAEAANCVEIATTPTTVHIRDSKTTHGPHLTVAPTTWTTFLAHATAALPSSGE